MSHGKLAFTFLAEPRVMSTFFWGVASAALLVAAMIPLVSIAARPLPVPARVRARRSGSG
jgi:hypothetical protein